ncbi:hypothetical protein K9L05_01295 [Candidatus Babeliales bacterium]|nr:hypothetical protein [Candidatus Babeliales bacterium]MCF7899266.1 hypothetical protein [Candidatus Babeliales bacterium]
MRLLTNFAVYIQNLNRKNFEKYLLIFLVFIILLAGISIYYIYNTSTNLVTDIKNLEKTSNDIVQIIDKNEKLDKKADELKKLLDKNENFNVRVFFEQFIKEQNLTPEPNWANTAFTLPVEGNDKFDEVGLTATFKNQTTENLIKVIENLSKNQMIYIKDLIIKNQENKKIEVTMTLAAKKYRK